MIVKQLDDNTAEQQSILSCWEAQGYGRHTEPMCLAD